jgi:glycosyltransferase involved in cell wall biosynthesis
MKYPVDEIGRRAWKMVVPEQNRAYIQKVGWKMDRLPYVLPNKPYYTEDAEITEEMKPVIEKMKQETKKIIIYLGVIDPDRDIESFAKAIETMKDEYAFYLFGPLRLYDKEVFQRFCDDYECVNYMGFFNPPYHLRFLEHADIALLPYNPGAVEEYTGFTAFNALYCAPNKIYEYAGKNLPMIGTDVPGLRTPFEKYNIGVCCRDLKPETIAEAVRYVGEHHEEMKKNLQEFYDSTDIDKIVDQIVNEP